MRCLDYSPSDDEWSIRYHHFVTITLFYDHGSKFRRLLASFNRAGLIWFTVMDKVDSALAADLGVGLEYVKGNLINFVFAALILGLTCTRTTSHHTTLRGVITSLLHEGIELRSFCVHLFDIEFCYKRNEEMRKTVIVVDALRLCWVLYSFF